MELKNFQFNTVLAIKEAMKTIDRHLCEVEKPEELDADVLELLRHPAAYMPKTERF